MLSSLQAISGHLMYEQGDTDQLQGLWVSMANFNVGQGSHLLVTPWEPQQSYGVAVAAAAAPVYLQVPPPVITTISQSITAILHR